MISRGKIITIPKNPALGTARMTNMEEKFKRDPKFHEMYATSISGYIKQRHAAKVTSDKSEIPSNIINYLPHTMV